MPTDRSPDPIAAPIPAEPPGFAGQPQGLSTLFFTEVWERFSYYGMRALLVLFIVAPTAAGGLGLGTMEAARIYGNYTMAVYMLSIPGGFIADRYLGAHRSVLIGGAVIACGHFTLAIPTVEAFYLDWRWSRSAPASFKPNISAMAGGLYAREDERRDAGFSIFYMGVNLGRLLRPAGDRLSCAERDVQRLARRPRLRSPAQSWHWGFAAAGVGMTLGLVIFLRRRELPRRGGPRPARSPRRGPSSLLVIAGTLRRHGLTVLSDDPRFQWLRAFLLLVPIAAIGVVRASSDIDGRRFRGRRRVLHRLDAILGRVRAGRHLDLAVRRSASPARACSAGRSPLRGTRRSMRSSS